MRAPTALLTLLLFFCSLPWAAAQPMAEHTLPQDTVVTFRLEGMLHPPPTIIPLEGEAVPQLPDAILQRLDDQSALARLDLQAVAPHRLMRLRAYFIFPNLRQFNVWYGSQSTQALLQALGEETEAMTHAVRMRRFPQAYYVGDDTEVPD